jgi:DNA modification methylase
VSLTPYWQDDGITIWNCDVMDGLRQLSDESVHCVVTSPPYWGLRDYGTAKWEGGNAECVHKQETQHQKQGATSQRQGRSNVDSQRNENFRNVCGKCGARRIDAQIGLEATPELYVARMIEVFREVRRVLRKDGTLWLNLGDCYQGGNRGVFGTTRGGESNMQQSNLGSDTVGAPNRFPIPGLKPKDLVGIPWRVAFALQADGWYLRSDIIWSKPNPMPQSVTDRPTTAHEYVFLLGKSATYYYDSDAIRESHARNWSGEKGLLGSGDSRWAEQAGRHDCERTKDPVFNPLGRNRRSVWTIATNPYCGAHFATFPEALVEPCIKAGCPLGGMALDPFAGAGTVGLVARRFGCNFIGIELNPAYCEMTRKRLSQIMLPLDGSHAEPGPRHSDGEDGQV